MKRGMKRGHYSRSRPLERYNNKFQPNLIEKTIKKRLKTEKSVRVLEVGCGEGRVLLELRRLFPNVELFGINKKPWLAMKGQKSLKPAAIYYKIFNKNEINKIELPKIYFYDAKKLKFKSNYLDLIISQVSVPYIKRKDLFLEEVWRTLKVGGQAFLHIDTFEQKYPDFMRYETPRFIIYRKNKPTKLEDFIKKNMNGFEVKKGINKETGAIGTYLKIKKINNSNLRMKLKFDELSSFNLDKLKEKADDVFWGFRSVFKMK